jgi:SOS-response transcriptional repressor LexA
MRWTVGRWVRQRREDRNLSREDLVRMTGLGISTIKRVEADGGESNRGTLLLLAHALDVQPPEMLADWALGVISERRFFDQMTGNVLRPVRDQEDSSPRPPAAPPSGLPRVEFMTAEPGKGTPVLGEITAGGFVESIVFDPDEEPERVPLYYPEVRRTYALRIRGDSMAPEYRPGEILIVRDATPNELEDGEDAVIQCNGGNDGCSTFKRCVFLGEGRVRLMPLNDAYKPLECTLDHIVRIGKVLGVYRPRRFGGQR